MRQAGTLLSLSVAAVLGAGAFAGEAAAAPAAADPACPFTRTVCLWDGVNTTGTRYTAQATNPATGICVDLAAHGWGSGRTRSARNTGTQLAKLYTGSNCTGGFYQLTPGGTYNSITFGSNSIYVY